MTSKERINFMVRELQHADISNGFLQTLSNLAQVGNSIEDIRKAEKILLEIKSYPFYKIFVAVKDDGQIIGSTTLLIEQKFIHSGGKAGHIEDVVTRNGYEGKGIGRKIIEELIKIAKESKCYKITLDCDEKVVGFYEKLGFKKHQIMMRINI